MSTKKPVSAKTAAETQRLKKVADDAYANGDTGIYAYVARKIPAMISQGKDFDPNDLMQHMLDRVEPAKQKQVVDVVNKKIPVLNKATSNPYWKPVTGRTTARKAVDNSMIPAIVNSATYKAGASWFNAAHTVVDPTLDKKHIEQKKKITARNAPVTSLTKEIVSSARKASTDLAKGAAYTDNKGKAVLERGSSIVLRAMANMIETDPTALARDELTRMAKVNEKKGGPGFKSRVQRFVATDEALVSPTGLADFGYSLVAHPVQTAKGFVEPLLDGEEWKKDPAGQALKTFLLMKALSYPKKIADETGVSTWVRENPLNITPGKKFTTTKAYESMREEQGPAYMDWKEKVQKANPQLSLDEVSSMATEKNQALIKQQAENTHLDSIRYTDYKSATEAIADIVPGNHAGLKKVQTLLYNYVDKMIMGNNPEGAHNALLQIKSMKFGEQNRPVVDDVTNKVLKLTSNHINGYNAAASSYGLNTKQHPQAWAQTPETESPDVDTIDSLVQQLKADMPTPVVESTQAVTVPPANTVPTTDVTQESAPVVPAPKAKKAQKTAPEIIISALSKPAHIPIVEVPRPLPVEAAPAQVAEAPIQKITAKRPYVAPRAFKLHEESGNNVIASFNTENSTALVASYLRELAKASTEEIVVTPKKVTAKKATAPVKEKAIVTTPAERMLQVQKDVTPLIQKNAETISAFFESGAPANNIAQMYDTLAKSVTRMLEENPHIDGQTAEEMSWNILTKYDTNIARYKAEGNTTSEQITRDVINTFAEEVLRTGEKLIDPSIAEQYYKAQVNANRAFVFEADRIAQNNAEKAVEKLPDGLVDVPIVTSVTDTLIKLKAESIKLEEAFAKGMKTPEVSALSIEGFADAVEKLNALPTWLEEQGKSPTTVKWMSQLVDAYVKGDVAAVRDAMVPLNNQPLPAVFQPYFDAYADVAKRNPYINPTYVDVNGLRVPVHENSKYSASFLGTGYFEDWVIQTANYSKRVGGAFTRGFNSFVKSFAKLTDETGSINIDAAMETIRLKNWTVWQQLAAHAKNIPIKNNAHLEKLLTESQIPKADWDLLADFSDNTPQTGLTFKQLAANIANKYANAGDMPETFAKSPTLTRMTDSHEALNMRETGNPETAFYNDNYGDTSNTMYHAYTSHSKVIELSPEVAHIKGAYTEGFITYPEEVLPYVANEHFVAVDQVLGDALNHTIGAHTRYTDLFPTDPLNKNNKLHVRISEEEQADYREPSVAFRVFNHNTMEHVPDYTSSSSADIALDIQKRVQLILEHPNTKVTTNQLLDKIPNYAQIISAFAEYAIKSTFKVPDNISDLSLQFARPDVYILAKNLQEKIAKYPDEFTDLKYALANNIKNVLHQDVMFKSFVLPTILKNAIKSNIPNLRGDALTALIQVSKADGVRYLLMPYGKTVDLYEQGLTLKNKQYYDSRIASIAKKIPADAIKHNVPFYTNLTLQEANNRGTIFKYSLDNTTKYPTLGSEYQSKKPTTIFDIYNEAKAAYEQMLKSNSKNASIGVGELYAPDIVQDAKAEFEMHEQKVIKLHQYASSNGLDMGTLLCYANNTIKTSNIPEGLLEKYEVAVDMLQERKNLREQLDKFTYAVIDLDKVPNSTFNFESKLPAKGKWINPFANENGSIDLSGILTKIYGKVASLGKGDNLASWFGTSSTLIRNTWLKQVNGYQAIQNLAQIVTHGPGSGAPLVEPSKLPRVAEAITDEPTMRQVALDRLRAENSDFNKLFHPVDLMCVAWQKMIDPYLNKAGDFAGAQIRSLAAQPGLTGWLTRNLTAPSKYMSEDLVNIFREESVNYNKMRITFGDLAKQLKFWKDHYDVPYDTVREALENPNHWLHDVEDPIIPPEVKNIPADEVGQLLALKQTVKALSDPNMPGAFRYVENLLHDTGLLDPAVNRAEQGTYFPRKYDIDPDKVYNSKGFRPAGLIKNLKTDRDYTKARNQSIPEAWKQEHEVKDVVKAVADLHKQVAQDVRVQNILLRMGSEPSITLEADIATMAKVNPILEKYTGYGLQQLKTVHEKLTNIVEKTEALDPNKPAYVIEHDALTQLIDHLEGKLATEKGWVRLDKSPSLGHVVESMVEVLPNYMLDLNGKTGISGKYVQESVLGDVTMLTTGLPEWLKVLGAIANPYKQFKVIDNPAGQLRNTYWNFMTMYIAGVEVANPLMWKKLGTEMLTDDPIWRLAKEQGIDQGTFTDEASSWSDNNATGIFMREITEGKGYLQPLGRALAKGTDVAVGTQRLAGDIYKYNEIVCKYAIFRERLKQGDTPAAAAKAAQFFLFNYDDVSMFLRTYRVIPFGSNFATWSTKVAAMLPTTVLRYPFKVAVVLAALYMINEYADKKFGHDKLTKSFRSLPTYVKGKAKQPTAWGTGPVAAPWSTESGYPDWIDISKILPQGTMKSSLWQKVTDAPGTNLLPGNDFFGNFGYELLTDSTIPAGKKWHYNDKSRMAGRFITKYVPPWTPLYGTSWQTNEAKVDQTGKPIPTWEKATELGAGIQVYHYNEVGEGLTALRYLKEVNDLKKTIWSIKARQNRTGELTRDDKNLIPILTKKLFTAVRNAQGNRELTKEEEKAIIKQAKEINKELLGGTE